MRNFLYLVSSQAARSDWVPVADRGRQRFGFSLKYTAPTLNEKAKAKALDRKVFAATSIGLVQRNGC